MSDSSESSDIVISAESEIKGTIENQEEAKMVQQTKIVQEEIYKVKELIDNCKALGYKKEIAVGALFNCIKTEMSKSEFKENIKSFLGKKVN